jgi:hypothetical protein
VDGGIETEQDAFAFGHYFFRFELLVQGASVDDRLCPPIAAQDDEEV